MKSETVAALAVVLLLILSFVAAAGQPALAGGAPAGWVTLLAEDFEAAFPHGLWHIGRTGDPYLWGQRSCNPHRGIYSMWAGGGGSQGAQTPCSSMYTTSYVTTLSYGPLDLSGCSDLRLNFAHWTHLGAGDALAVGFSIDGGTAWHVVPIYGNAVAICGGWCEESFEPDRWPVPLCGQGRVYLLFRFSSNAAGVSYGAFVDDVSLDVYYGGAAATATSTPSRTATATPVLTPTKSATATHTSTRTRTATITRTATRTATWPVRGRLYLPVIVAP